MSRSWGRGEGTYTPRDKGLAVVWDRGGGALVAGDDPRLTGVLCVGRARPVVAAGTLQLPSSTNAVELGTCRQPPPRGVGEGQCLAVPRGRLKGERWAGGVFPTAFHVEVDAGDRDRTPSRHGRGRRRGRGEAGAWERGPAGGASGDAGAPDWTVVEPVGCCALRMAVPAAPVRSRRSTRGRGWPARGVVTASVSPAGGR